MGSLIQRANLGSFFKRWRVLKLCGGSKKFKVSNRRGNCCVVVMDSFKGRRSSLFIPEGRAGEWWISFREALERILLVSSGRPKSHVQAKVSSPPILSSSFREDVKSKPIDFLSIGGRWWWMRCLFLLSRVLVVKDFAYDSWDLIDRGFRMRLGDVVKVKLFCDNLALLPFLW